MEVRAAQLETAAMLERHIALASLWQVAKALDRTLAMEARMHQQAQATEVGGPPAFREALTMIDSGVLEKPQTKQVGGHWPLR